MKRIITLLALTFCITVSAQKPKMEVARHTEVTTTQRDAYVVPEGEHWKIYNTTNERFEYWTGLNWVPIGKMNLEEVIALDSLATSIPNFSNGLIIGDNSSPNVNPEVGQLRYDPNSKRFLKYTGDFAEGSPLNWSAIEPTYPSIEATVEEVLFEERPTSLGTNNIALQISESRVVEVSFGLTIGGGGLNFSDSRGLTVIIKRKFNNHGMLMNLRYLSNENNISHYEVINIRKPLTGGLGAGEKVEIFFLPYIPPYPNQFSVKSVEDWSLPRPVDVEPNDRFLIIESGTRHSSWSVVGFNPDQKVYQAQHTIASQGFYFYPFGEPEIGDRVYVEDEDVFYIFKNTGTEDEWVIDSSGVTINSTSELVNDGEDGINPFITANDVPIQEGYSETGTRINGDLEVSIGDYDNSSLGTYLQISDLNGEFYFYKEKQNLGILSEIGLELTAGNNLRLFEKSGGGNGQIEWIHSFPNRITRVDHIISTTVDRLIEFPDASGVIPLSITDGNNSVVSNAQGVIDISTLDLGGGLSTLESYFESGTRLGGDLITTIGDYDDSNNGTKLTLNDNNSSLTYQGDYINYFNTSTPLFGSSIYHNKTLVPESSGTFAYETRVLTKNSSTSGLNNTFYGDIRNITDASNDDGAGTTGLALFTRNTGTRDLGYLYATDVTSRHSGTGDVGFLNGQVTRVIVDGINTSSVSTVSRTLSTNTTIDNPNTTVAGIQGYHSSVNLQKGSIGGASIMFMDFDISSSPDLDITGDLFYIGAGDDNMSSVNNGGFKRFISYTGNLDSYFGGAIEADSLVVTGKTSDDILLGDGTTTSLSALGGGSSTIAPILVTDSTYTFLEANILESKVHIFNVVADTIVATLPQITIPNNEMALLTIKTLNENNVKLIPASGLDTQVEFSPRVKGEAFSVASLKTNEYAKWDNVNQEDYVPLIARPSLVQSTDAVSTGNSITFNSTPTTGNYLIVQTAKGNFKDDPITPTGWTLLFETVNNFGEHAFFGKISDGTETSQTFQLNGTSGNGQIFIGTMHEFNNVNQINPYEGLVTSGRNTSSVQVIPATSSTIANSLALILWSAVGIESTINTVTNNTTYTETHSFSDLSGSDGWNLLYTKEVEVESIDSGSLDFSSSPIGASIVLILNPE